MSEAPSPPSLGFVWDGKAIFVGSESGQIQSVKLLQIYGLQHNSTPQHPLPAAHFLYLQYCTGSFMWEGGGRGGEVNKREG
jgi:hypothetical protein